MLRITVRCHENSEVRLWCGCQTKRGEYPGSRTMTVSTTSFTMNGDQILRILVDQKYRLVILHLSSRIPSLLLMVLVWTSSSFFFVIVVPERRIFCKGSRKLWARRLIHPRIDNFSDFSRATSIERALVSRSSTIFMENGRDKFTALVMDSDRASWRSSSIFVLFSDLGKFSDETRREDCRLITAQRLDSSDGFIPHRTGYQPTGTRGS